MADFSTPMSVGGATGAMKMEGMGSGYLHSTLDEPVTETIMRDVRMVGSKMMCVLNPQKANINTLKDWDLWGPLILCLTLATLLSWFAPPEQKSLVFASVFVIIWCGAAVVTVNALLLGGNISFFQSVCVLGYCIFPLNIASVICLVFPPSGNVLIMWRTLVVAVCFFWSTGASLGA
jgi:protein YIPF6